MIRKSDNVFVKYPQQRTTAIDNWVAIYWKRGISQAKGHGWICIHVYIYKNNPKYWSLNPIWVRNSSAVSTACYP